MKELKQGDLCYVSDISDEDANICKYQCVFICMDGDLYVARDDRWKYFSWKYAVPVEEVEEEVQWRVGDYYVNEKSGDAIEYGIISSIVKYSDGDIYIDHRSLVKYLRKPTPEELEKYFR